MRPPRWFTILASAILVVAAACSDQVTTEPSAGGTDAGETRDGNAPAEPEDEDAGAAEDAAKPDENSDGGEAGAACSFNRDCALGLRCECDESSGCACAVGKRGSGRNGLDACDSGNDCASAVCVEGPNSAYVCSGECTTEKDCTGDLPKCSSISFVGRICVRSGG